MPDQMLKCADCGEEVQADWKNCPSCGVAVEVHPSSRPALIQVGDGNVVNANVTASRAGSGSGQPLLNIGSDNVVEANINASTQIHVEGQYIQNQTIVNVSPVSSDLQSQIEGQSEQVRQIGKAVQKLLEQHHLQRRELRPGDSLSIRNDNERELVKQLVSRYRSLPENERRQVPALLSGIGKLEVVAGDFDSAQKDFQQVALLEQDQNAQAEAYYNAYLVSLEKRDWPGAIQELVKAVKLDPKRFAPFPAGKYQPIRILGAGGFGVAFLCKHKYMDAQIVVKTLSLEALGRDADKVFTEAQVLRELEHASVIRISDCGYVDATNKSRPFLVMDYFAPGTTLEDHVKQHGPLAVDDLISVARQVAEGLHAAHRKNILHRDVKPANLLIRKDEEGWRVKVIDFGLALRQKVVQNSMKASTDKRSRTLVGGSIAGTMDYAPPEQMGKREGEGVGSFSDIYGWAKTCCYALFQTTQPTMRHWKSVPEPLAELLGRCLEEDPKLRPQSFQEAIESLNKLGLSTTQAEPITPPVLPLPIIEVTTYDDRVHESPRTSRSERHSESTWPNIDDAGETDERSRGRSRRDDDRRPGRSEGGFRCHHCGTSDFPINRSKISTAGWIVFGVMLLFCFPLFFIGLLMKENYRECGRCGMRIGSHG
ncbi:MAG: hypothetical protein EXS09_10970 [Gemmataceae bacterium]|nr:hypothetical protein [Gemmataceae bacterium]